MNADALIDKVYASLVDVRPSAARWLADNRAAVMEVVRAELGEVDEREALAGLDRIDMGLQHGDARWNAKAFPDNDALRTFVRVANHNRKAADALVGNPYADVDFQKFPLPGSSWSAYSQDPHSAESEAKTAEILVRMGSVASPVPRTVKPVVAQDAPTTGYFNIQVVPGLADVETAASPENVRWGLNGVHVGLVEGKAQRVLRDVFGDAAVFTSGEVYCAASDGHRLTVMVPGAGAYARPPSVPFSVYQGWAKACKNEWVTSANTQAVGGDFPDWTAIVDIPRSAVHMDLSATVLTNIHRTARAVSRASTRGTPMTIGTDGSVIGGAGVALSTRLPCFGRRINEAVGFNPELLADMATLFARAGVTPTVAIGHPLSAVVFYGRNPDTNTLVLHIIMPMRLG